MTALEIGQKAPAFTLQTTEGEVSLADLVAQATKGVIIYFYPKAGTPGCTTQACDFQDSLNSLKSAGYSVIGISPDSPAVLEKFAAKEQLNFTLASDPAHQVMEQYGAWGEKKNYGKTVIGTIRSTFVVDSEGIIRVAQYAVKATGHVARLRETLGLDQ